MLKKENKREKAKKLLLSEQRKTAINIVGVFQKFFRRRKFKNKNYASVRNKKMSDGDRERRTEPKNYY